MILHDMLGVGWILPTLMIFDQLVVKVISGSGSDCTLNICLLFTVLHKKRGGSRTPHLKVGMK